MSDFESLDRAKSKIARRDSAALNFDLSANSVRPPLVLDTNTIILGLKKKLPQPIRTLLATSPIIGSSVVIGEITQGYYNLDPADPRTAANRVIIGQTLEELGKIDRITPTDEDWRLSNAVLASLSRRSGFDKVKRRELLADTLLYVGVRRAGATLVTANTSDFDYLEQALPSGRILYYQALSTPF